MIESKLNKMWYDGLNTTPGFDQPWEELPKGLHKFICFGPSDAGNGSADGDAPDSVYSPFGPSGPLGEVPNIIRYIITYKICIA